MNQPTIKPRVAYGDTLVFSRGAIARKVRAVLSPEWQVHYTPDASEAGTVTAVRADGAQMSFFPQADGSVVRFASPRGMSEEEANRLFPWTMSLVVPTMRGKTDKGVEYTVEALSDYAFVGGEWNRFMRLS